MRKKVLVGSRTEIPLNGLPRTEARGWGTLCPSHDRDGRDRGVLVRPQRKGLPRGDVVGVTASPTPSRVSHRAWFRLLRVAEGCLRPARAPVERLDEVRDLGARKGVTDHVGAQGGHL